MSMLKGLPGVNEITGFTTRCAGGTEFTEKERVSISKRWLCHTREGGYPLSFGAETAAGAMVSGR